MIGKDIISTLHMAASELMSWRISKSERASHLYAMLAVSERTCVEMEGEPTNNGAAICALVDVCPRE